MIKQVLILTGACGVGKSTIAKLWAKAKKGAVVESDYFTEWLYSDRYERFQEEEEALVADVTFATAKEYLKHRLPVAIENVWSPKGLERLKSAFESEFENIQLQFIWLVCDTKENQRRDALRVEENQMKERVDIVNAELRAYVWPAYLKTIDSTHLTEEDTLIQIEKNGNTYN